MLGKSNGDASPVQELLAIRLLIVLSQVFIIQHSGKGFESA